MGCLQPIHNRSPRYHKYPSQAERRAADGAEAGVKAGHLENYTLPSTSIVSYKFQLIMGGEVAPKSILQTSTVFDLGLDIAMAMVRPEVES